MAATDAPGRARISAIVAAALALPGVMPRAQAEAAPDTRVVTLRYLAYRDWQPGARRMDVESPSLYLRLPLAETWTLEGSVIYDAMSGASPLWHDTLSGASGLGVTDHRTAADAKLRRYDEGGSIAVGIAGSAERDYRSQAASFEVSRNEADGNRTWVAGIAVADDRIDSVNGVATGERRRTLEFQFGVTQAWNADMIVATSVSWAHGNGYYSDPYKPLDTRPRSRDVVAWLTRIVRSLPGSGAVARIGYRYQHDSFGASSHTVDAEFVQPLAGEWMLTPRLRYYSQHAADFYRDPVFPQGYRPGSDYTADTRLSAFGAFTPGLGIEKRLAGGWSVDARIEFYRQRSAWHLGGDGSPGLSPLSARWFSVGVTREF